MQMPAHRFLQGVMIPIQMPHPGCENNKYIIVNRLPAVNKKRFKVTKLFFKNPLPVISGRK